MFELDRKGFKLKKSRLHEQARLGLVIKFYKCTLHFWFFWTHFDISGSIWTRITSSFKNQVGVILVVDGSNVLHFNHKTEGYHIYQGYQGCRKEMGADFPLLLLLLLPPQIFWTFRRFYSNKSHLEAHEGFSDCFWRGFFILMYCDLLTKSWFPK